MNCRKSCLWLRLLSIGVLAWALANTVQAAGLEEELGRSEVRVRSAPFALKTGGSVWGYALDERLDDLGYRRVKRRPVNPGEYFWGTEIFWIYRHAFRFDGRDHRAMLLGLALNEQGDILHPVAVSGEESIDYDFRLEPQLLAEDLEGRRGPRFPLVLDDLPKHVWQVVLAAEDARFFDHSGVDGRSLARALLANAQAGKVTQGGSTITQQLIKNRDLTPKRTLPRKVSEAVRALALEAEYDKREILQAYLNQVYLGHLNGLAIHGFGAAARGYFSKAPEDLSLAEAAVLAAMIQGPNRLSPVRHPKDVLQRRNWVLSRMEDLEWASEEELAMARKRPLKLRLTESSRPIGRHFLGWLGTVVEEEMPQRRARGRGLVAETTLDPWLQKTAEVAVKAHLRKLRRREGGDKSIHAALVTLDAQSGDILAYVGGDPDAGSDQFDRVRRARRQPGSAVKPLVLLEAFEDCGGRAPLSPASRVADKPLVMELPSGPWQPRNSDEQFRGVVSVRQALRESLNVPLIRVARWCDFRATAKRLRETGLQLDTDAPPSFTLGAIETSPLELARAYTVLA